MADSIQIPAGVPGPTGPQGPVGPGWPIGLTIYADSTRTDSYTADGSFYTPFKTIQAAIDYAVTAALPIIVLNVNTAANAAEALVINAPACTSFIMTGNAQSAIASLTCTTNNDSMGIMVIEQLSIGSIHLVGASNNTDFGGVGIDFINVEVATSTIITNCGACSFIEGTFSPGTIVVENCGAFGITGGAGVRADITGINNLAHNVPNGFFDTFIVFERAIIVGDIAIDAGSELQFRIGCRIGAPGSSINTQGSMVAYSSLFRGDITVGAAGEFINRGSFWLGSLTIAGGGSFTNQTLSSNIGYTATDADWANPDPINVQTALTRMAALLRTLNGGTPIP